jgi:hypothetical protein
MLGSFLFHAVGTFSQHVLQKYVIHKKMTDKSLLRFEVTLAAAAFKQHGGEKRAEAKSEHV